MIVVYTPEGGEPQQYNERRLLVSEASAAAAALGMRWTDLREALGEDDPAAMRAVAWVMRKRVEPALRFKDFDPGIGELATRFDEREIRTIAADALTMTDVPRDERDAYLARLVQTAADPARAEAIVKELTDPGPKEPEIPTSPSSESSTSASSLTSSESVLPLSTD